MTAEPTTVDHLLAAAASALRAETHAFDAGAGLRRLAEDAGYVTPPKEAPAVSQAHQQLTVVVRWALDQPGAAEHVERLAEAIGKKTDRGGIEDGWVLLVRVSDLEEIDVDGAHVFACMLHLAGDPESAQFWWQFAAGAGNGIAACCLHLHHLGRGETDEADHWLDVLISVSTPGQMDETFLHGLRRFAIWEWRHAPRVREWQPALTEEVYRLATRGDTGEVLVCRPDHDLAVRLQGCGQAQ